MKFKAELTDANVLIRVLQSLEKIDDRVVLHMQPTKLSIIARSDVELGLQAYCALMAANSCFESFVVESKSNNNIMVCAMVSNLLRALKSAQSMQQLSMKLSKKTLGGQAKMPCLVFTTTREGPGGQEINIVHDVPLKMLNEADFAAYEEPQLDQPGVELYLPPMKIFRSVIDRFKTLTSHANLRATGSGLLSLTASPTCLEASMDFHDCVRPQASGDDYDPDAKVELKIDLKKLSRVLYAEKLMSNDVIASFYEDTALALHFLCGNDMFSSYYVPLTALDPDAPDCID